MKWSWHERPKKSAIHSNEWSGCHRMWIRDWYMFGEPASTGGEMVIHTAKAMKYIHHHYLFHIRILHHLHLNRSFGFSFGFS